MVNRPGATQRTCRKRYLGLPLPPFGLSRALKGVVWCPKRAQGEDMLWTIVAVFLILWLLGFSLSIGGSLIHLLLVVALVIVVINLLTGRRGAA